MKYFILLLDGSSDYKIKELGNKTPLEAADKPVLDSLARKSIAGLVSNVPDGMVPESDTANLAVMSYDPREYSKGRSPLEAVSMGIDMKEDETAFRCNVVTLEGEGGYESLTMLDHSADEITTAEADQLISAVGAALADDDMKFYTGVSYRHCLIWRDAPGGEGGMPDFMRPHDILGRKINDYLPPEPFLSIMKRSYDVLKDHPVNIDRIKRNLRPANSIWLWSPGKKPALPSFKEKWGLSGAVISAVDLIKGIGICAGMKAVAVEGATGNIHTNYGGKANAAIQCFNDGFDFVYLHVEAPDECGHRGEIENKVKSIELIDEKVLTVVLSYLENCGEPFKIMALPDHPTPLSTRTHAMDPVPFIIYSSDEENNGVSSFTEDECKSTSLYIDRGHMLLDHMIIK